MRHIKISFGDKKEAKRLFQELPFYNVLIGKPCINNINLLYQLSFYDEISIEKISQAFTPFNAIGTFGCHLNFIQLLDKQVA